MGARPHLVGGLVISSFSSLQLRVDDFKIRSRWYKDHFKFVQKFAEIFASHGAPPVSTTPVANCRRYQRHRRQICHRYQRHRRQILPPVPFVLLTPVANNGNNIRLLTPESELEGKKFIYMFPLLPKGDQTKLLKFFWLKSFNGIFWGWGETDSWKEPEAKNLVTLSL